MPSHRWDELRPPAPWEQEEDSEQRWDKKLQQARAARETPPSGLRLGTNLKTELPLYINPKQLSTHMQVIGATNVGKSYFLEGIIKQLILAGEGVCLLDPHGDLYERLIDFCALYNIQHPELKLSERVIPFNIAETRNVLGFNPTARNARVMTYQVVALMEAIRKCWGQESFEATPRLARWLFNTNYAVIDSALTMAQMYHMVDSKPNPYRPAITARIHNPRIRAEWEWLSTMRPDKREERLESTFNRMRVFVEHELIRNIVGQYTHTLDFPSVLAGRKILLVNLARQGAIAEDDQHLLGSLIVNEILTAAFARGEKERTPFYLFIDEFQNFVSKDMCEILDGGRKFGLHLTLANQHLAQLREKDPEVYYSTLTNARLKVVFGGLIDQDLDVLARELYTGEFNPDEIKDEIWQTKFEPVETTRLIHSSGWASSSGSVNHQSIASGQCYIPGSGFWSPGTYTHSTGSDRGRSQSENFADSGSATRVPFYEFHKFSELTSKTFRSLEEQVYIKKAQMKRQATQHAAVLIPGNPVQLIKAPTLRDCARQLKDRQREEFLLEAMTHAGCFKSPDQAAAEITAMDEKLLAEAEPVVEVRPTEKKRGQRKPSEPNPFDDILREHQKP